MRLLNLVLVFAFSGLLLTGCQRGKKEEVNDYVPQEEVEANGVGVEVETNGIEVEVDQQ